MTTGSALGLQSRETVIFSLYTLTWVGLVVEIHQLTAGALANEQALIINKHMRFPRKNMYYSLWLGELHLQCSPRNVGRYGGEGGARYHTFEAIT